MKKLFFFFSLAAALESTAQDSVQLKKALLLKELKTAFAVGWKLDVIDSAKRLKWDTLNFPSFLIRVNLFSNEFADPATIYFFDITQKDSATKTILKEVLYKRIKELLITTLTDSNYVDSTTDLVGFHQNDRYFALSLFREEEIYEPLNAIFAKGMNMPTPKMEITLVDIKQEEKKIEPPPPPPPRIKPPKAKLKKKD